MVAARAEQGKNYGVVLIPEGLIEHIPEMNALIKQLNDILATEQGNVTDTSAIASQLDPKSRQVTSPLYRRTYLYISSLAGYRCCAAIAEKRKKGLKSGKTCWRVGRKV